MPRDKKTIHRATSDVEDETLSDEETTTTTNNKEQEEQLSQNEGDSSIILEERKKFLKNAILKRTLALKQQRERGQQQRVNSTK